MVVFDASFLLFLFDPSTPASVPQAKERIDHLVETLSKAGEKIVVPTPALSECMVHAGPRRSRLFGDPRQARCLSCRVLR